MIHVMIVFGTRPEAVKMIPLIKEIEKHKSEIKLTVCVTAQHRQMVDSVLEAFNIVPDYDFDLMKVGQTLADVTALVLEKLDKLIKKVEPNLVLVHGDTTTSFAGALAAFYSKIKIGHVEAGLRTFDKYSPYPEEINRRLVAAMADFHFAPTELNRENLVNEGINSEKIFVTGNTVIDALALTVDQDYVFKNITLSELPFHSKKIVIVTAHRRENWGKPLENICEGIKRLVEERDDVCVVYPMHLNPVVRDVVLSKLGSCKNVKLIEPLEPQELHNAINKSYMVMTDSGGLQEEAPALGKPVLVLRNETERSEAVEAGTVKVVGVDAANIFNAAISLINDQSKYQTMARAVNPYGDGRACERIVTTLLDKMLPRVVE